MSKVKLIGKNIGFLALNRLVVAIVNFILFPFIVGHVGKEVYGIYLIVLSLTGYLALMDFGVMSALTKYVSEYRGKEDEKGITSIISASFSFYVLIGIIIATTLFIMSMTFQNFINTKPEDVVTTRQLFMIAACSAIFVWPMSTFKGVTQGYNLWNMDASVSICSQILNAVATFTLLSMGFGIIFVFLFNQLFSVLGDTFLCLYLKRKHKVKVIFPYTDWKVFRFIFNFSFFVFLSSLVAIFIFQIHNIMIGCFLTMSAVSVYAVAYNMQHYLRSISAILVSPFWTLASEMEGRKDIQGQRNLLLKGTKYVTAAFLPAIIIVLVYAEPFINYWVGPGFQESVLPARILILYWCFTGCITLSGGMLSARGVVRKPLLISLAVAIVNVIIVLLFINKIGILAPALGLSISMIFIASPLTLRLSLKELGISFKEFFEQSIKVNLLFFCLVGVISWCLMKSLYPRGMMMTFTEMALLYLTASAGYFFFILNKQERNRVFNVKEIVA